MTNFVVRRDPDAVGRLSPGVDEQNARKLCRNVFPPPVFPPRLRAVTFSGSRFRPRVSSAATSPPPTARCSAALLSC